uniref:Tubulin-specific chaperone A n=1 Tax=Steinernema glaseri TaxID=37863 RepID=A0A1I7YQ55_9BILA
MSPPNVDASVIRKKLRDKMQSSTLGLPFKDVEVDEKAVKLLAGAARKQIETCITGALTMALCRTQSLDRDEHYERLDDPRGELKHLQEAYAQLESIYRVDDKKELEEKANQLAWEQEQRLTERAFLHAIGPNASSSATLTAVTVPRNRATTVRVNERDLLHSLERDQTMAVSHTRTLLLYRGFKKESVSPQV